MIRYALGACALLASVAIGVAQDPLRPGRHPFSLQPTGAYAVVHDGVPFATISRDGRVWIGWPAVEVAAKEGTPDVRGIANMMLAIRDKTYAKNR